MVPFSVRWHAFQGFGSLSLSKQLSWPIFCFWRVCNFIGNQEFTLIDEVLHRVLYFWTSELGAVWKHVFAAITVHQHRRLSHFDAFVLAESAQALQAKVQVAVSFIITP